MKNNTTIATRKGWVEAFFSFLILAIEFAIGIVIAFMLLGCKHTEYIEVEKVVEKHDTLREVSFLHDSIHLRDSIYFHEWIKGDTVYSEKVRDRWHYVEHTKRDTIIQKESEYVREPIPYPVIKYVEKPFKKWQISLMLLGFASLVAAGVWIWIKIFKK